MNNDNIWIRQQSISWIAEQGDAKFKGGVKSCHKKLNQKIKQSLLSLGLLLLALPNTCGN